MTGVQTCALPISVTFTPPANTGGSAITGYTATAHDQTNPGDASEGKTASGDGSPITISGLKNGDTYTFTVAATNGVGTGPASDQSGAATPADVPGAPKGPHASAAPGQATITFTPPADSGGSAISGYTVTAHDQTNPADATDGKTATGSSSPIVVTGLKNGDSYTFTVTATNGVGTGRASDPTPAVTPADVPGAPTGVQAAPANHAAVVSFTAPADIGGSAITGYKVTAHDETNPSDASDGKSAAGTAAGPITVTGLNNGDRYTFTVIATNGVGDGPASDPSASVTPVSIPGAPTNVSAVPSDGQAVVSFDAPSTDGGSPITGYEVVAHGGSNSKTAVHAAGLPPSASGSGSPITVTGLSNGVSYTFTVTAKNALGTGPSSQPSGAVTPSAQTIPPPSKPPAQQKDRRPVAKTGRAMTVKLSSAQLTGMLNPQGPRTRYRFEFGTSKNRYRWRTSMRDAGAGTVPRNVSLKLSRLKPGTVYHYRLVAVSSAGKTYGKDRTFKTPERAHRPPAVRCPDRYTRLNTVGRQKPTCRDEKTSLTPPIASKP